MTSPCRVVAGLFAAVVLLAGCRTTPVPQLRASATRPREVPRYFAYFVKEGDTLASIGRKFGLPWQRIRDENDCGEDLRVGQVLLIPAEGPKAVPEPPERSVPREEPPIVAPPAALVPPVQRDGSTGRFQWPLQGRLTRRYGDRLRRFSEPGIGIQAPGGRPVRAIASGEVICCVQGGRFPTAGWGNVVAVRHYDGWVSWYGQLGQVSVDEGQSVGGGAEIGTIGSGGQEQTELAFRLFRDERPVDPLKFLP